MAACESHLVSFLKSKAIPMPRSMTSAFSGFLQFRGTQVNAAESSHAKNP